MCVGLVFLCDFIFFVFGCFCRSDFVAPNEDIVRFSVGVGIIYLFVHIFVNFFTFCMVFLLDFKRLSWCCDWFSVFDSFVASLYMGWMCMMEHFSTIWSPISLNNSISHVRFCAYLVHLIINFWCQLLFWVWWHSTWLINFQFLLHY